MQGCRVAYNSFVIYHNFRHAVDVLQSVFYFLVTVGILPPYPNGSKPKPQSQNKSPVAQLLGPFEAFTLLVSAIGHDVGHPGVNNMFLVKLNAPLAQLYNDSSVLEAFHCAAYSQILRRHWPAAFNDKPLRKLMISSILATDMGVHSHYMQQLGHLQEKIHESKTIDSWSPKEKDDNRVLACGLLIKCADISNVARPWFVAERWTHLLQDEFAHQGEMERAVGMETTLFGGPPEIGNMLKLANGQIGFMTIFAHPLFANVADIIPSMDFAADEITKNKGVWFTRAENEKLKNSFRNQTGYHEGNVSPRTQSPVGKDRKPLHSKEGYFPSSPLRGPAASKETGSRNSSLDTGPQLSSTPRGSNADTVRPGTGDAANIASNPMSGPAADVAKQRMSMAGGDLPTPVNAGRKSSTTLGSGQQQHDGNISTDEVSPVPTDNPSTASIEEESYGPRRATMLPVNLEQYRDNREASGGGFVGGSNSNIDFSSTANEQKGQAKENLVAHEKAQQPKRSFDEYSGPGRNGDRTSMGTSAAQTGKKSPSTEATSFLSGVSDDEDRREQGMADFGGGVVGDMRSRALSSPMHLNTAGTPVMTAKSPQMPRSSWIDGTAPSAGAGGQDLEEVSSGGTKSSEKQNIRISSSDSKGVNGDIDDGSGTFGRRKSKLKIQSFFKSLRSKSSATGGLEEESMHSKS